MHVDMSSQQQLARQASKHNNILLMKYRLTCYETQMFRSKQDKTRQKQPNLLHQFFTDLSFIIFSVKKTTKNVELYLPDTSDVVSQLSQHQMFSS